MKRVLFFLCCLLIPAVLFSQSLIILNRTGFNILEIHYEYMGETSGNLILYDVLMDQDYLEIPVDPEEGMIFYFTDESGDGYRKDYVPLSGQPKMVVTIQDLQVLSAGDSIIRCRVANQTDSIIIGLFISPSVDDGWGEDLLSGAILRPQESVTLQIPLSDRGLYDIHFLSSDDDNFRDFYLHDQQLRDMGFFALRIQ